MQGGQNDGQRNHRGNGNQLKNSNQFDPFFLHARESYPPPTITSLVTDNNNMKSKYYITIIFLDINQLQRVQLILIQ